MRSRDIRFVHVRIMAQGGDSNKRWTLKCNWHKSEFEKWIRTDRPGIEMVALEILFCANCLWMHGMGRVSQLDSRLQIAGACVS